VDWHPNFHFDVDPDPDPERRQNDADPHADPSPSFTLVGKSEKNVHPHSQECQFTLVYSSRQRR
jgi:hypothetical protein